MLEITKQFSCLHRLYRFSESVFTISYFILLLESIDRDTIVGLISLKKDELLSSNFPSVSLFEPNSLSRWEQLLSPKTLSWLEGSVDRARESQRTLEL